MDEQLLKLLENSEGAVKVFKDRKAFESILAIKELFMEKILERGDIRLLISDTLSSGPKHGYQIMKTISKKFLGFYKPSPGVIYPTLQSMEEEGLLRCEETSGKRLYSLTGNGRELLRKNKNRVKEIYSHARTRLCGGDKHFSKCMDDIIHLWIQMAYEIWFRSKAALEVDSSDVNKKLDKIEEILRKTLKDLQFVWK